MISEIHPNLQTILAIIPENPGCYMYFDETETLIYVGKAKNLKKRVSSYFHKDIKDPKTRIMIRKIRNIRYIVVASEAEAFLLENNLIKESKPRYNIMLKDDKTYPWIVVRKEPFPRIYLTRKKENDGSHYYGPYTSVLNARNLLRFITALYPIRNCKYFLSKENVEKKKFNVCLQYHIKNCLGPCRGYMSEETYLQNIRSIEEILKGNVKTISRQVYNEMLRLSSNLQFEEAEFLKEKYALLENYSAKSVVVSSTLDNIDVFSYIAHEQSVYINYMHIASGSVVQVYTIEYKIRLDEPRDQILAMGILELRTRFESNSREIIVPFIPDMTLENVQFNVPQKGDKKKLLDLSEKNVQQYKIDQLKHAEKLNPAQRATRILTTLKTDLHLHDLPVHIECFDNSNIQGTNPVSACVVFKMGKPSKKDYRHFNIKTVTGPDDFQSMYETVFRRYRRMLDEDQDLPQLIVIDGGKGQLHAATRALEDLDVYGKMAIIGIAKRLEEIYFPNDPIPLYLDKNSESLKLIQQLRDEAHRFGITFHRKKRSKQQIVSELDTIKGIGPVMKEKLLKKYKSVKRIREAPFEEILELIGEKAAKLLLKGLSREA
jgi:excinuclease ABC, C subunit